MPNNYNQLPSLRSLFGEFLPNERVGQADLHGSADLSPTLHHQDTFTHIRLPDILPPPPLVEEAVVVADPTQEEEQRTTSPSQTKGKRKLPKYSCEWNGCHEEFRTRSGLATHCSEHLKLELPKRCLWLNCRAEFPSVRELVKHLAKKSHVGQTPFIPRENSVMEPKEKSFLCPFCFKQFTDASNQKKHEEIHNPNRKRFYCDFANCNKSYSTKADLKIHTKIHSGNFTFQCSFKGCTRSFIRNSELYSHERTHDRVMPHVCTLCNRGFSDKTKLTYHCQKHHP